MDGAVAAGIPLVGLVDSGGARIQDGVGALAGYTRLFRRTVAASGVVPQLSVVLGACAGGAVYAPALTDWVVMEAGGGSMFLTGPGVVRAVCREEVTGRDLGGAAVHARVSGVVSLVRAGEVETLRSVRQLLSYLPPNWREPPPVAAVDAAATPDGGDGPVDEDPALDTLLPASADAPYDMTGILSRVLDAGSLFPMHDGWAPNVITAFARLGGRPVGVVANQPAHLAGVLDADASVKAARFVRFCDAFGLPILTFTDVPGFLPGTAQEAGGVIRHGAKLLYAYAEATVPKLGVIVRKAFGGAYCVMSSKELGGDVNYAWPSAAVAVMGARGAVGVLKGGAGKGGPAAPWGDPDVAAEAEYAAAYENPLAAVRSGEVDAVIPARATRGGVRADLARLASKGRVGHVRGGLPKKHGCIPL
ncbi:hypothetical protein BU14_2602s0001 [Porphyra umbilicalis]|uniref:Propionyl-CoA carboxylase beta chain, mitochondrial n=1 Tax=Porphyra umbilicalis TaxID=2786 RepID=A0A1X6NIV8_PORUM|nr:hypothetical protein BU14_2602s0001 [Porphyra umbilicalis]|eukprot:OSX68545.1 hypothetical protein BU14_2602s0001 [Porphyra umbilicalis]